jgi:hypothetical protein
VVPDPGRLAARTVDDGRGLDQVRAMSGRALLPGAVRVPFLDLAPAHSAVKAEILAQIENLGVGAVAEAVRPITRRPGESAARDSRVDRGRRSVVQKGSTASCFQPPAEPRAVNRPSTGRRTIFHGSSFHGSLAIVCQDRYPKRRERRHCEDHADRALGCSGRPRRRLGSASAARTSDRTERTPGSRSPERLSARRDEPVLLRDRATRLASVSTVSSAAAPGAASGTGSGHGALAVAELVACLT